MNFENKTKTLPQCLCINHMIIITYSIDGIIDREMTAQWMSKVQPRLLLCSWTINLAVNPTRSVSLNMIVFSQTHASNECFSRALIG